MDRIWQLHADQLRETWQARALRATRYEPIGMVILSMLAHSFDEAMPVLLRVLYPGFESIRTPFICSHGKINKRGQIIADVVWEDWCPPTKDWVIFENTQHLQSRMRKVADKLKLKDDDRVQFFTMAKRWVTADMRLDPNMDPRDPDARCLIVN